MSDPVAPNAGRLTATSPTGRRVLACAIVASGMAMLDGTIVTVALPRIGADLDAPLADLQWTLNAYMLTLAGLLLLGGGLGDRFGRRRILVCGVVWFTAASLLCGIAPHSTALVVARALQGVGGALVTPGSLALLQSTFHPDERAKAVGLWSGLSGVAVALGPFLGGWIVDGPGWRWMFFLNLPLAAVVLLLVRHVPETRDWQATGRFDVPGAACAGLALTGVTYALIAAGEGDGHGSVWTAAAGLALGAVFVWRERRAAQPMLPLEMFSSRLFTVTNLVTLCLYAAMGGVFFLIPLQLQNGLGYDAVAAGVGMLPVTLLMMVLSGPAGALSQRIGPRWLLTLGPLLAAGGMLLLRRAHPGGAYWPDVLPGVAVMGLGMGVFVAPLTASVLASVDVRRAGAASGVNNAAARVAQLVSVAALPWVVGLTSEGYRSAAGVDAAFGRAMVVCAGLMAVGGLVAWATVPGRLLPRGRGREAPRSECPVHCGVSAPPLEPGRRGPE